ncbi:MAG: ATP-grasp domain-containing protein, partial [Chloroflexi bacterium]|nr:ATP-grasp domain-containing protein [Chloroflexota bacterium]
MIEKVLIANRGEIALRVLRACEELGLRAVVAYSEADRDSLPVRLVDEAICIGPASPTKSYLNVPNVISAALITGCDAVHPGYGFLAENPYVAEICQQYDLVFVGPPARVIEEMADKALARRIMHEAGLPVLPGTFRPLTSLAETRASAEKIGYPVILKAAAGGGGRGMRVARDEAELVDGFALAAGEAQSAFGNGALYLEKFLVDCRHVEVQVLVDQYGHGIHLGERECSVQRRHQKLLEEAPSCSITPEQRARLGETAVQAVQAIGYVGAGTLEFLVDPSGSFAFMEMNTRIQV